jgi:hypothetical protein
MRDALESDPGTEPSAGSSVPLEVGCSGWLRMQALGPYGHASM